MAYVKKNLTPAERSEIARKAAAARKSHKGGRPKGWRKDPERKEAKVVKTITVYEEDYKIYRLLADRLGKTLVDTMHDIAEGRKKANPDLFNKQPDIAV